MAENNMMISKNFTYEHVTNSVKAKENNIDNTLPDEYVCNAIALANAILEPIMLRYNISFSPTSWYRCEKLNKLVGGSRTSEHLRALAVDIPWHDLKELFKYVQDNLIFNQLIIEPDCLHVSYSMQNNKQQTLKMLKINGIIKYIPYRI